MDKNTYDTIIIGAGPGGLACAIKAAELGLRYVMIEKGSRPLQGIIDSYPRGKKVFPTIPKAETGPYPIADLEPGEDHPPIERINPPPTKSGRFPCNTPSLT